MDSGSQMARRRSATGPRGAEQGRDRQHSPCHFQPAHQFPRVRTVGIKWPNDIVIQNTAKRWLKCAGILIENTWRGTTWDGLLVGVGVNVNSTHMEEPRRCALGEFTAAPLPIANVEAHLAQHVLDALEAQDAPSDYDAHLVGRDQTEQFSFEGQSGAGTVKAVNADGALEMEWTPEGGRPKHPHRGPFRRVDVGLVVEVSLPEWRHATGNAFSAAAAMPWKMLCNGFSAIIFMNGLRSASH